MSVSGLGHHAPLLRLTFSGTLPQHSVLLCHPRPAPPPPLSNPPFPLPSASATRPCSSSHRGDGGGAGQGERREAETKDAKRPRLFSGGGGIPAVRSERDFCCSFCFLLVFLCSQALIFGSVGAGVWGTRDVSWRGCQWVHQGDDGRPCQDLRGTPRARIHDIHVHIPQPRMGCSTATLSALMPD